MCIPTSTIDLSTQANIDQVKTTHLHLNWNVDFEAQNLNGNVVLDLVTLVDNVNKVVLDTSYLDIKSISLGQDKLKVHIYTYILGTSFLYILTFIHILVSTGRSIC